MDTNGPHSATPPQLPGEHSVQHERTSLAARMVNILATPGEVFGEVLSSPPQSGNWLAPAIIACLMVVVYQMLAFSQDSVVREITALSTRGIQAQIDAGKIPPDMGAQQIKMVEGFMSPRNLIIFGSVAGVFMVFVEVFATGLVLWLVASRLLKTPIEYLKVVELCGLTMMVDAVQKIARGLLVVWKGTVLSNAGPILLVDSPSMSSKRDLFLATLDLTDLWWLSLLALALSATTRVPYLKTALGVFVIWFGLRGGMLLLTPSR